MKKEKAIFFKEFMLTARETFYGMLSKKLWGTSKVNGQAVQMDEADFQRYYDEFIQELKDNILEYQDIDFICDYLVICFSDFIAWNGFKNATNKDIINADFEVKFLKNLKHNIEKYRNMIADLYYVSQGGQYSTTLKEIFAETLKTPEDIEFERILEENESLFYNEISDFPAEDKRFDFDMLKVEANKLEHIIDRIKLVTERLYDLEQWELQNDNLLYSNGKAFYEFSTLYYPKFKELCQTELTRYEKLLEIESRKSGKEKPEIQPVVSSEPKPYKWAMSNTDFLELFVALYQNECVERRDGNSFTRKEFLDYLQDLFGLNIKDVEGKLAKASNRKMNRTPFLDKLKTAFENYVDEKEEKLKKRR